MLRVLNRSFGVCILGLVLVGTGCLSSGSEMAVVETPSGEKITVEVSRSVDEKEKGLSGRSDIGDGMLFCYEDLEQRSFWMKGMLTSIDVVWLFEGQVTGVEAEIPVSTDDLIVDEEGNVTHNFVEWTKFKSPGRADAVLEVPYGRSVELGIERGVDIDSIVEVCAR